MLVESHHQSVKSAASVVPALCAGSGADRRIPRIPGIPRIPRAWRSRHPATRAVRLQSIVVDCNRMQSSLAPVALSAMRTNIACETSPSSPRSGEIFVAVGCAYSRYPRYRMQNQPHPGGVQQHTESTACCTPPGCNVIEKSIPWVLQTHGYKHYTTPWCVTSPSPPRSGDIFVAVGCAYSRYPRYRTQNQPHPGGVQQHAESSVCCTPPGCDMVEQSIPWVARIRATHGYQHCSTPWCGNAMLFRMALCAGSGADRRILRIPRHPRIPCVWRRRHPATRAVRLQSIAVDCNRIQSSLASVALSAMRTNIACETSPSPPRSGEIFVAVGCAYSRHPRYRMQNQPHPGGVQQNVESSACCTPPGCDMVEQSIPWVARIRATHGYQHCTTPWCGNALTPWCENALASWRYSHPATTRAGCACRRRFRRTAPELQQQRILRFGDDSQLTSNI